MSILYENQHYVVSEDGIESKPHNGHTGGYFIEANRLNTDEWFAQMRSKLWWDAASFADAFYKAKELVLNENPDRSVPVEFEDLPTWYASLPEDHPEKTSMTFREAAYYAMSNSNVYPMVTVMLTPEDAAKSEY